MEFGQRRKSKRWSKKIAEKLDCSYEQIVGKLKHFGMLHQEEFIHLLESNMAFLKNEPNMLSLDSPIVIVGDVHGQFYDLLSLIQKNGLPSTSKYLFLGDYVDRGEFGIEVLILLLWLKIKYPTQVFLLRGNHESKIITSLHNFRNQCRSKYSTRIYELVIHFFETLPLCALVDRQYFCVHAGISPQLKQIQQIQKINRFTEVPTNGMLCDLLWSDPSDEYKKEWAFNTERHCSYFYSKTHASEFMKNNGIKCILRAHQVQIKGYSFKEMDDKKIITIFSAPNYCGTYRNLGAFALINKDQIKLRTFKNVESPSPMPLNSSIMECSLKFIYKNVLQILMELMKQRLLSQKCRKMEIEKQLQVLARILKNNEKDSIVEILDEESLRLFKCDSGQGIEEEDGGGGIDIISVLAFMALEKNSRAQQAMPKFEENISFGPKIKCFQKVNFKHSKSQLID